MALIVLVSIIALPLNRVLSPTNLVMLYLAAVVVAAVYLGRGPSMLAAILGVLAFDYLCVPPRLSFAVGDSQYLLTFVGLFLVSLVISTLMAQVREQAATAQRREAQAVELYELSRDLAGAATFDAIVEIVLRHVSETFQRLPVLLLPENGTLRVHALVPHSELDPSAVALATWSFEHGQPAGYGTGTSPAADTLYLPLKTVQGVVGVLGLHPVSGTTTMASEQRRLLEVFASQAALALERAQLAEHARQMQLLQATEKLQGALLNSISHELRTPLVSITGAFSALEDDAGSLDETARRSLISEGRAEAERLNRLVGNLLDMTRIEAGALRIREELGDVAEAIGTALERFSERLCGHEVVVAVPADLPLVPMDFVLVVQVLVNLLDNAIKYSPPGSPVSVTAHADQRQVEIAVADRGSGSRARRPAAYLRQVLPRGPAGQCERHGPGPFYQQGNRGSARRSHLGRERACRRAQDHLCVAAAANPPRR